jgi:phosphatidylglycerol:prolipoprotein diacylglycerol transferase
MDFQQQFILIRNTFLGDIQIRYYGIIVVTAMIIAAWVATRLAQGRKFDPDHVWGALTWGIFPGIIGARLWFVLFPPAELVANGQDTAWFFANFFNTTNGAIAIWSGGLGIFGAILGGLLGVWLYFSPFHNAVARVFYVIFYPLTLVLDFIAWIPTTIMARVRGGAFVPFKLPRFETTFPSSGMPMLGWLDIGAVVLPLAQFIGRWANYVNQELYGTPTNLSWWGIPIDFPNRVAPYTSPFDYPQSTLFHPLFLYEGLWSLIAFFVLLNLYQKNRNRFKAGDFMLLYVIQYTFIRFWLEFIRVEVAYLPGTTINSSQVASVVLFAIALVVFLVRRGQTAKPYDEATALA